MRVPSSSNSNSAVYKHVHSLVYRRICLHTNGDGLDSNTFLNMGICRIISILCLEDLLST